MDYPERLKVIMRDYIYDFKLTEPEIDLINKLLHESRSIYDWTESSDRKFPLSELSPNEVSMIHWMIEKQDTYERQCRSFNFNYPGDLYTRYLSLFEEGQSVFFNQNRLSDVIGFINYYKDPNKRTRV